jgi:hypothetical protein
MGPLLASGRDADVFAIDAQRVLRRYRDGSEVTAEAAVMRSARGPVVIDWDNAAEGLPELDVALSALILAEVVVAGVIQRACSTRSCTRRASRQRTV